MLARRHLDDVGQGHRLARFSRVTGRSRDVRLFHFGLFTGRRVRRNGGLGERSIDGRWCWRYHVPISWSFGTSKPVHESFHMVFRLKADPGHPIRPVGNLEVGKREVEIVDDGVQIHRR